MTLAIIFDSVGAGEWLVLLAVLLVVIGPERLPATARKLASHYAKFRRAAESFKRQLMDMDLEMEREFRKAADEVKKVEAEVKTDFYRGACKFIRGFGQEEALYIEDSIAAGSQSVPVPDFTNGRWICPRESVKGMYSLDL